MDILERALEEGIIPTIPNHQITKTKLEEALIKKYPYLLKDEDEAFYSNLIEESIESGLPIPPEIEGDVPELPLDLTTVSDSQIRFFHGAFLACAARARWKYSFEEAGEAAAKQIADHYEEEYIIRADRKDYGGKAKPMALLKSEASAADNRITKWRKREKKHAAYAGKYKRITETYDTYCERLSREWTMRTTEKEN